MQTVDLFDHNSASGHCCHWNASPLYATQLERASTHSHKKNRESGVPSLEQGTTVQDLLEADWMTFLRQTWFRRRAYVSNDNTDKIVYYHMYDRGRTDDKNS